jgi:hypothetical protein
VAFAGERRVSVGEWFLLTLLHFWRCSGEFEVSQSSNAISVLGKDLKLTTFSHP